MKKLTLFAISYFVFLIAYGQEERYILNPIHTKELISKLSYEPIVYSILKKKRMDTSLVDKESLFVGNLIASNALSGSFIKVDDYVMIVRDYEDFSKNELVLKDEAIKAKISEKGIISAASRVLIKDVKTKAYYYVSSYFLKKFDCLLQQKDHYDSLDIENKRRISISRIDNIKYPIREYSAMIDQCRELTDKLKNHNDISQTGVMSKTQIVNWKRDIIEAKLLNFRIGEFVTSYEMEKYTDYAYSNDTLSENYDKFQELLKDASKHTGL